MFARGGEDEDASFGFSQHIVNIIETLGLGIL